MEPIPLDRIKDGGAQMRVETNADTIEKYAADMLDGAVFPPVILFDDGAILWPGDGFHRIAATRRIKRTEINAEIRKGTARDAILHAVGANAAHGLPRTNADKRRAVETLLRDAEWQQLSDRDLAKLAKVSHVYVGTVRKELAGNVTTPDRWKRFHAKPTWKLTTKPNGHDLIGDVLRTIPDHALIAECRRRGLTVEAGDV